MSIKITSPMVVDLDRFTKMRNRFVNHYYLANCDPNFGGQEIQVPWASFSKAIADFADNSAIDVRTVGVRFVHCFDEINLVLYERMQIVTLTQIQESPRQYTINDSPCTWYKLINGTMTATNDTDLFNADYLESFYYCRGHVCGPTTVECLADDTLMIKYARTVTMPWAELLALYTDNFSPADATLCFDAGCRCTKLVPGVRYQHTLMAYLRDATGTPLLDNEPGKLPFTNKAADCGTLCPTICNMYVLPKGLTGDGDCNDENDIDDDEQ